MSRVRTVSWDPQGPSVRIIDQRLLPGELRIRSLGSPEEVHEAIRSMAVRGAPAIGAAAAFGLALAGLRSPAQRSIEILADLEKAAAFLKEARPTAANLAWALARVLDSARTAADDGPQAVRRQAIQEAERLADEDVEVNRRIGKNGATLLQDGDTVIHHCNTGALATVDYGTAMGVIRAAHEDGKRIHVLVDETRPRLQGARLTAWELEQLGISHEIIVDGAAGHFLRTGRVAAALVGADRVASNGDVANKVGTYMLALAAHDNHVPFYCAVPASTIDIGLASGEEIPIEERDAAEVLDVTQQGQRASSPGAMARNPAFDITPARLVSAFITEAGVLTPPYGPALARTVREAASR